MTVKKRKFEGGRRFLAGLLAAALFVQTPLGTLAADDGGTPAVQTELGQEYENPDASTIGSDGIEADGSDSEESGAENTEAGDESPVSEKGEKEDASAEGNAESSDADAFGDGIIVSDEADGNPEEEEPPAEEAEASNVLECAVGEGSEREIRVVLTAEDVFPAETSAWAEIAEKEAAETFISSISEEFGEAEEVLSLWIGLSDAEGNEAKPENPTSARVYSTVLPSQDNALYVCGSGGTWIPEAFSTGEDEKGVFVEFEFAETGAFVFAEPADGDGIEISVEKSGDASSEAGADEAASDEKKQSDGIEIEEGKDDVLLDYLRELEEEGAELQNEDADEETDASANEKRLNAGSDGQNGEPATKGERNSEYEEVPVTLVKAWMNGFKPEVKTKFLLTLSKNEGGEDVPISGYEIKVKTGDEIEPSGLSTNEDGQVELSIEESEAVTFLIPYGSKFEIEERSCGDEDAVLMRINGEDAAAKNGKYVGEAVSASSSFTAVFLNARKLPVPIRKTDAEGTLLAGATFQILDDKNSVVAEWTTDGEKADEIKLTPYFGGSGESAYYVLHEKTAPAGYGPSEDVRFTLSSDSNGSATITPQGKSPVEEIEIKNYKTNSLKIRKEFDDAGSGLTLNEEYAPSYYPIVLTLKSPIAVPNGSATVEGGKGMLGTPADPRAVFERELPSAIETLTPAFNRTTNLYEAVCTFYLHAGEEVSIGGLPEGTEWKVEELQRNDGSARTTPTYENEEGTLDGENETAVVTNVLKAKTTEFKKTVVGYDPDDLFLIRLNVNDDAYDPKLTFTDYEGNVRGRGPNGYFWIPLKNGKTAEFSVPYLSNWYYEEFLVKSEYRDLQLSELYELMDAGTTVTSQTIYGSPSIGKRYHRNNAASSGSTASNGDWNENFRTKFVNVSHVLPIEKVDGDGSRVGGAVLQILDEEETVVDEWTSGEDGPHLVGLTDENDEDVVRLQTGKTYVLHEKTTPEGYETADDVRFMVTWKTFSADEMNLGEDDGYSWMQGFQTIPTFTLIDKDNEQVDELTMVDEKIGTPVYDLTVSKIYDDAGTNAVLKPCEGEDKPYVGVLVQLENVSPDAVGQIKVENGYVGELTDSKYSYWSNRAEGDAVQRLLTLDEDSGTYGGTFMLWTPIDDSAVIRNLPEGTVYSLTEKTLPFASAWPATPENLFEIEYENESGTIEGDAEATIRNKLKTIDVVISKKTYGYDDGQTFYVGLTSDTYGPGYLQSFDMKCVDHDGNERHAVKGAYYTGEKYYLLVPIKDGETIRVTLPTWAWLDDWYEFGVKRNCLNTASEKTVLDEFYACESMTYMFSGVPNCLAEVSYSASYVTNTNYGGNSSTYVARNKPSCGTSAMTQDIPMEWVNVNRRLPIRKTDENGEPLAGATLRIVSGDQRTTYAQWTTGEDGTYLFSPNECESIPKDVPLLLQEVSAPEGYDPAPDIPFKCSVVSNSDLLPEWAFVIGEEQTDELVMADAPETEKRDIVITKEYDDADTNIQLKDNIYFGFQIMLKNIPTQYARLGFDMTEVPVYDLNNTWSLIPSYGSSLPATRKSRIEYETEVLYGSIPGLMKPPYYHTDDGNEKAFASFMFWLKPGESLTISGVPDGVTYEVAEITNTFNGAPPSSVSCPFEITYEGETSGTVNGGDVSVKAVNTLKTIDLNLTKEVVGYDDGRTFYFLFSAQGGTNYGKFENGDGEHTPTFIDRDGVERSFLYKNGYLYAAIPFRPEDGTATVKLPYMTHYFCKEYVPNFGVDLSDSTYEEILDELTTTGNYGNLISDRFSESASPKSGYVRVTDAVTSGSNRTTDIDGHYVNQSRFVMFAKADENGNPLLGAVMQIVEKDSEKVVKEWTSEEEPYVWNLGGSPSSMGSDYADKTLILREIQAPSGYETAPDIEFTLKNGTGTVPHYNENGATQLTDSYYYPYIDASDGEETFLLTMTDAPIEHDVVISKQNLGGEEIEGASLSITGRETGASEDIEPIEWISGSDGFEDDGETLKPHKVSLKPGDYVLHEEAAPEGYAVASDVAFTVSSDGTAKVGGEAVDAVVMTDRRTHDFTIAKEYDDNGTNAKLKDTICFNMYVVLSNIPSSVEAIELSDAYVTSIGTQTDRRSSALYDEINGTNFLYDNGNGGKTASFGVCLYPGESLTLKDVPEGVHYKVQELGANLFGSTMTNLYMHTEYENAEGDIGDSDETCIVTNVQNTVDYVIKKHALTGYDRGETFYFCITTDAWETTIYDSFDFFFTDKNGTRRNAVKWTHPRYHEEYYSLLIPIKAGDEVRATVPSRGWICSTTEYGVKHSLVGTVTEEQVLEEFYSQEFTADPAWSWTDSEYIAEIETGSCSGGHTEGNYPDCGYLAKGYGTSGITQDEKVDFVNVSDVLPIYKKNADGDVVGGACMRIADAQDASKVYAEWTSEDGKPYEFCYNACTLPLNRDVLLQEVAPPTGYAKADDVRFSIKISSEVVENYGTVPVMKFYLDGDFADELVMTDAPIEFKINKYDVSGSNEIDGAAIDVYKAQDVGNDGKPIEGKRSVAGWTSAAGENHDFGPALTSGESYVLIESATPAGYEKTTNVPFSINDDGSAEIELERDDDGAYMIRDDYEKHDVAVSKQDINGKEIAGAVLKITGRETGASEDIAPIEWESVEGENKTVSLKPGSYVLHEEAVPDADVYVKAADIAFTVDRDGNVKVNDEDVDKVTMVDEYATHDVEVSKTDVNGDEIGGASLKITGRETGASEDVAPIEWESVEGENKTVSLKPGSYVLHEEAAPDADVYVKAMDIAFTVDENGNVKVNDEDVDKVTMVDEYATHDVEVSKTDVNGDEIGGASLKITGTEEGSNEEIAPIEWESVEGENKTVSLKPGSYVLHEEAVPDADVYVLASDIAFTVDKNGVVKVSDEEVDKITMVDLYKTNEIVVSKTDVNGAEIAGASLKITGRETGASSDIAPISWTSGSDGDVNGTLLPHAVSLKPGSYVLHEEAVPNADVYVLASDIAFTVDKNGNVKIADEDADKVTMTDEYRPHEVEISKTDVNGDEIEGASLKITGTEEGSNEEISPIEWTSVAGENKTVSLKPGSYVLHEEAVPDADVYALASDIAFTVDKNGAVKVSDEDVEKVTMVDEYKPHDVEVSKTDVNGNEIGGARLKITDRETGSSEDMTPIEWESVEGENRTVSLKPGEYVLHEEAVPESGVYVLASDIAFSVDENGVVKVNGEDADKVTMVDRYAPHDVVISKTDVNGNEISGARLKITGRETGASEDAAPIEWTSVEGENKKVSLRPGEYVLHEEAAPETGIYVKASDIAFSVDENGNVKVADEDVDKVTMVDEYAPQGMEISKTDVNGNEIGGAKLKITGRETGASEDVIPIEWESVDGENKTVSLRPGEYVLHEEAVPDSGIYVKASDIAFAVDENGNVKVADEDVDKVTMIDEYAPHDVVVSKTDVNGDEIGGAKLRITGRETGSSENVAPIEWESVEGESKTVSLRPGSYILHEEAVPNADVYVLASEIAFTVDEDGNVKVAGEDADKVTMVDEYAPHDVVVSKTDVNGDEIGGAKLRITGREIGSSEDMTPIEWESVEGENRTVSLMPGEYVLHEDAAPNSGIYVKASDIAFAVDENGNVKVADEDVDKVTMIDEYAPHDVVVSKRNVNGEETEGAFLKITGREAGADSDAAPIEWRSGDDGFEEDGKTVRPHCVKLRPGSYVLHEEGAPEGFVKASDVPFEVTEDGRVLVEGREEDAVVMTDEYEVRKLKVSKTVTGNMGDREKGFRFTLTLAEGDFAPLPEKIRVERDGKTETASLSKSGTYGFELRHGETVEFSEIPYGTKYSVEENPEDAEKYSASSENAEGVLTKDASAKFVNDRNFAVSTSADSREPSGAVPAAVALTAIAVLIVFRRRRRRFGI